MKSLIINALGRFKSSFVLSLLALHLFTNASAQTTTFAKGSIIIDMGGAGAPTVANSLKPYGLIYDLLKNYNTPVSCVINSTKIKDGIDFVHNGKSFKGGPFIISVAYRSAAVNQAINNWRSQGVIIDSLVSDAALEVSYTLTFAPRWVMDATNGRLAVAYLTYAGIPASAYIFKDPSQLNSCDDIYAMPHAAPTWSTHNNLYLWNLNNKGAIWAGCSAASAMEALTGSLTINGSSTTVKMNFLTTTGLVLSANHNKAVTPFSHLNPTQPMAQYIGTSDAAQTTGAETVYMPLLAGAWNPSVKLITSAPNQNDIPGTSPGPAGVNVFGRAFNDATRGYVAYQGGHSYSPSSGSPTAAQIAAQRMFFNFSFFAIKDKLQSALTVAVSNVPTQMVAGTTYTGLTTSVTSSGSVTYQWSASVPGTFSAPTASTTSFTPSNVTAATTCAISCVVTDACGRSTFDTKGGIVLMPNGATISAAAISQSATCATSTISFNVFDYNTNVTASTRSLTAVSGFSHGTTTFTSAGVVNYTPAANFVGADNGTYTISNGVNSSSSTISITVGSSSLAPIAATDVDTVIEDNLKVIDVLANDRHNHTSAYIKDILTKPTKGYVYINSNGTLSYLSTKDVSSGYGSDSFTYLLVNDLGYTAVGTVNITILKDACTAGNYQTGINVAGGTQTLTFYPTADNYLRSSKTSSNYGGVSTLSMAYSSSGTTYKPLLKFDVSSIPTSTTITSATLILTYSSSTNTSSTFPAAFYNLRRNWTESGSTWSKFDGTNNWSTSGAGSSSGDYYSTPTNNSPSSTSQTSGNTISSVITSNVQSWVTTPASNYGFLMKASGSSLVYFHSKEATTVSKRPKLEVVIPTAGTTYPCSAIPTNYKPVIYPITSTVNSNATVTISPALSYNYYGNTNNLLSVTTPAHGTATISGSSIIYDPADSYFGADTLTYTVRDATNNVQNTATIFVTVNRVAPTLVADAASTNSNTPVDIFVTTNDVDPQGPMSAPIITVMPQNGSAVVSGTKITYTPIAGFTGTDYITYSRSSSASGCTPSLTSSALVTVQVLNQNPVAGNDNFTTPLCSSYTVDLFANDSDPEGTNISVSYISTPSHGTLTEISAGVYKYKPAANYSGQDQFTYKIKDASSSQLESALATVSITVTPVQSTNNSPVAIDDNDNGMIGQPIVTDVINNDTDPDSDTLDISISAVGLTQPAHGTISLLPNGQISYQPNNGYYGSDSYQYEISDRHESCNSRGASLSSIATVTLNVSSIPITVSGTVWSDPNNSGAAGGTIYTNGEVGTNIQNSLYAYLVDAGNVVIDLTPVASNGTYSLVNTPSSTNGLKILLSTTSYSLGSSLSISGLPTTHVFTSASSITFNSSTNDITGNDFGLNQKPVATISSLNQQSNPSASMSVTSSNFTGTDEAPGTVTQIHYTSFPTNISSITIGATSYTSLTWPGAGVTVNTGTSVSIIPGAGSVTVVISFKVIDNGGQESNSAATLSIPLYVPLTAGSIGGGSSSVCGTAIPAAFTSAVAAAGGQDVIQYQWESSSTSSSTGYSDIAGATDATYTPTLAISATTYFRRRAYSSLDAAVYSNVITVTFNAAPSAPSGTNGSRAGTGTVSLSATPPSGSTVDWYANETGGSALLSGNNNYTTPSISYTTNYFVESRNTTTGCLSATRTMVTATVTGVVNPGVIANSVLYVCGADIPNDFTSTSDAVASAGSISYQWQYSTDNITFNNCTDDASATTSVYTPVNTISQTTYYRRKATDNNGSGYSNVISITYKTVPSDPVASDVARTGAGSLILAATPVTGITFDWYSDAGANTSVLIGSNNYTTPVISVTTPSYVSARSIANGCSSTNIIQVNAIINAALDGGVIGSSASICGSGTPSSFTSTADASNGTGTINYQWQKSTTSSTADFTDIAGATSSTYTSGSISTTTWFRRGASTSNDATVYSNVIEITINPLPSISITPASPTIITGNSVTVTAAGANSYSWSTGASTSAISVSPISTTTYTVTGTDANTCQGTASVTVTVNPLPSVGGTAAAVASTICASSSATINLTGYTGTIVWQSSPDGTNWTDTTVTASQLQTVSLVAGYRYYRAKVTNATAAPDYSNAVIILINPATVGGSVSGSTNVCTGTNSTVLSLSGQTGAVTKWQKSTNSGTSWTDIVSTSTSYTATNISQETQYRAVVTSGACPSENSSSATLTIDPVSVGGTISGAASVCTGTNSTTLTLSGYTGSITKWQSSTASDFSSAVTDIANTTTSLTATNLTQTTYYRAVITSGACSSANSATATVTVDPVSVGGTISGAASVCTGTNSTSLTLSGYTGSITKWQSSTDGTNWSDIANTTTSLTATNLTQTTYYRAVITSGACSSANSATATVTVNPVSVGGTISGAASVCTGTNSATLTLSGYTGSITKWQSSTDGTNWSDIANTTTSLTATNLTQTTYYRAVITSGACSSANSATATVTVNQLPTFSGNGLNLDGSNDYVQISNNAALNITNNMTMEVWVYPTKNTGIQNVISKSSNSPNTSYIFPRTDDGWSTFSAYFTFGGTWQIINTPFTTLNAWHHLAMTYDGSNVRLYMDGTLVKTQSASGNISTNSNSLVIGNQPGFSEFYGGSLDEVRIWNVVRSQAQIQANMNNELAGNETGLVAYYKFNEGTPGGNNTAITTTPDSSPNGLTGTLNGFAKTGSTSNYVASSVGGAGSLSGNSSVCIGSTITLSNTTAGGVWSSSNTSVATVGSSTGVVTGVAAGTATITYTITNVSGCTNTATKTITVNTAPIGTAISGTTSVCVGLTTTLSNSTAGGVWSSSNTSVATVGSSTGVVSGVAAGTAMITYTYTNGSGCSSASTATVTVNALPVLSANTGTASACVGSTTTLSNSTSGGTWSSSNTSVATVASTGVVTGVAAGTATITYTYTNGNGCTSTATTSVTINALPTVSAITGNSAVCVGSTITLSSATSGGVWTSSNTAVATISGSGVVTGVSVGATTITYTVTNGNGCVNSVTANISITALPVVSAISGSTSVCIGSSITLSNSTAGGVWSSSNNAIATVSSGGVVTGLSAGTVTITYTVTGANGCAPVSVTSSVSVNPVPSLSSSLGGVNIVTTNLKVNLDAGNSSSYSGSGSTWYDLTGNNLNGTISGATFNSADGGSFSFDGISNYVRVGAVPNTGNASKSVSFGVWVSPNTANGNIVSMSNTNPQGSWNMPPIAAYTSKFDGKIWNANHLLSSDYTNNNWYYVVIVFDYPNQTQTLYVNGVAVATQSGVGYASSGVDNYFFLGQANPGADNRGMFQGRISALHIYGDKALSLQEVQQNYNAFAPRYSLPVINTAPSGLSTCSGDAFTYTPTSAVTGTSYNWTRAAVTGISNAAASGTGAVNEVLVNTTNSPITVTYVYTLSANGCSSSQNVSVVVNPLPVLSANTGNTTVCVGSTTTLSNSSTGGTWASANTSIATVDANTGVVTGVAAGSTTITYTYIASGGCTSSVSTTITVSPVSVAGTASSSQLICAGTQPNSITLTGYVGAIQWQISTNNQNWSNISGATSATLTSTQLGAINTTSYVRAIVTNSVCSSATSNVLTLTIDGVGASGDITSPFTSLGMARNVTTAGVYYFNLGGTTFSSYVDANGWVQVIHDYGQTSGDITQVTSLDHVARAILNPTVLSTLTDANEIRISSNSGTLDVTNNNPALLSRVVNNQSISVGGSDNAINVGWTGLNTVGATFSNSGCDNGFSFELHRMVFHACGDGASGFHWLPTQGYQTLNWSAGQISGATTIELWVRAPASSGGGNGTLSITGSNSVCQGSSITLANNAAGGTWLTSNASIATISSTGVVTGVAAGTVTITYNKTSSLGCLFTATKTITVNALPTTNAISNLVVASGSVTSAINFTGSAGTSWSWVNNTTSIGLAASGNGNIASFTAVNTTLFPIVATITVTPTNSSSCVGSTSTFTITVNPPAQVNPVPTQVVTNGQSTTTINFSTINTTGVTTYQWTNNNTSVGLAASGSGSVPAFVGINNGTFPQYAQITVTPYITSGGITTAGTPIIVLITVNPTPQVNPISSQVLNNGQNTTAVNYTTVNTGGTTTYAWTNNTTSIGLASAGAGNIASFTAINNGTAPVVAILSVVPTFTNALLSTTGSSVMFTITVNPTAQVNAVSNQVISSGQNTAAVNFATNNTGGTTTYAWTNNNTSIGLAASGSGNIPSFVGVNNGTTPVVATITVTPTYTNAGVSNVGSPITFTITVNPVAQVNQPANQVVSNGQNTAAVNFATNNTGGTTTYAWTNTTTSIGLAASGTGNIAAFTAINNGTAPVVATITVTPTYTSGGISTAGVPITFTITVNPTAQVNQPANQVISNGQSTAAVNFGTINTGGTTTYAWTNNTTSIGLAANGTGNIAAFTGVNTSTAPVVATIIVTPTYTNAGLSTVGAPITFTITVNPTPQVNQVPSQVVSNGQNTAAVNFGTLNTGGTTTFAWTNNTTSIGLAGSGTGNIAAFTAINTGSAPVVATITVVPTFTNAGLSTVGAPITFTITVNPSGQVNQPANQVLNHGQNTTSVVFSTINTGGTTTYAWTNNATSIGLAASGTGDIASFTAINTGVVPVVATITVTPTYTSGGLSVVGVPKTFTITVNPIPTVNAISNQVVCNAAQLPSVVFSGAVTGTVYNWTNNTTGIGLAASGTGNLPVFTAVNTGTSPIIATITVTPTFTNGGVTATGVPKTFTITVNPTTVVSAGTLPSRICISDSLVQLNGTPVGGYWTGMGADGFNFMPYHTAIGSFTLTYNYVNGFGCSSSASIVAKVEPCLERDRTLADDAAVIYPIPSDGHITLKINSHLYDKIEMRLYKANGQYLGVKVFSGLTYGKTFSLDLSYLPNGVYFAKLTNDIGINGGYKVIRFIVQH